jgi:hypothetical protein
MKTIFRFGVLLEKIEYNNNNNNNNNNNKYFKNTIWKKEIDSKCRLCKLAVTNNTGNKKKNKNKSNNNNNNNSAH